MKISIRNGAGKAEIADKVQRILEDARQTLQRSRNICPAAGTCDLVNNASENCFHYRPHFTTDSCLDGPEGFNCPGCVPFNFSSCPAAGTPECSGKCSECEVY